VFALWVTPWKVQAQQQQQQQQQHQKNLDCIRIIIIGVVCKNP